MINSTKEAKGNNNMRLEDLPVLHHTYAARTIVVLSQDVETKTMRELRADITPEGVTFTRFGSGKFKKFKLSNAEIDLLMETMLAFRDEEYEKRKAEEEHLNGIKQEVYRIIEGCGGVIEEPVEGDDRWTIRIEDLGGFARDIETLLDVAKDLKVKFQQEMKIRTDIQKAYDLAQRVKGVEITNRSEDPGFYSISFNWGEKHRYIPRRLLLESLVNVFNEYRKSLLTQYPQITVQKQATDPPTWIVDCDEIQKQTSDTIEVLCFIIEFVEALKPF